MRLKNSFRFIVPLLIAAATVPVLTRAQSQDAQSQDTQSQTDSVADAARKARAQKKASSEKPVPVITDDILKPSAPAAAAAGGDASASAASAEGQAGGGNGEKSGDKAKSDTELNDLKGQVEEAQRTLDLAKRELSLEQDKLYSKPDYTNDAAGKAKVNDLNEQVTDKQQALDDLKARLAEAQAKADAQAPPSQEPPPPPQPLT